MSDFEIKLGEEVGESDESEDYTEDAVNEAGEKVCAALDIDPAKAEALVRTLRPLLALIRDDG